MRKIVIAFGIVAGCQALAGCVLLTPEGNLTPEVAAVVGGFVATVADPFAPFVTQGLGVLLGWAWQKVRHQRTAKVANNLVVASLGLKGTHPEAYALLKATAAKLTAHNPTLDAWQHKIVALAKGEKG